MNLFFFCPNPEGCKKLVSGFVFNIYILEKEREAILKNLGLIVIRFSNMKVKIF
jgi:hypothetical protein